MLCIYHIADHDGKGSAAVVRSVYPETEFLGINHDMKIPYEEIEKQEYNLSVSTYVEQEDTREVIDIVKLAHEDEKRLGASKPSVDLDAYEREYKERVAREKGEVK